MTGEFSSHAPPLAKVSRAAAWQPGLQPVWSDPQGCWCTSDHWVFRYEYGSERLNRIFRLPRKSSSFADRIKDALARSWVRRRWAPGVAIDTLVVLASGEIVLTYDQIYLYSPNKHHNTAEALPFTGQPGLASPLRGGLAVHGKSQHVYFGEYLNGHQRDIRVARVDVARRQVEVCWSFPRSEIKHIHAVHYDRFRNRLWLCTGDLDHESAFYYTDDEFQTVHRFAGGDQSWRAIALLFDATGMEWGMDAGQDAPADAINHIYRYDFRTEQRTRCAVIGNPAYAACELNDGTAVIQTSFEPKRRQATPETVALWWRGTDHQWTLMMSLPFQVHSPRGMGRYGHLLIPNGVSPAGVLLCTPVNTAANAFHMLRLNWSH